MSNNSGKKKHVTFDDDRLSSLTIGSPNNMSDIDFSVYIAAGDKKEMKIDHVGSPQEKDLVTTKLQNIYPLKVDRWISSDMIINCQICQNTFGVKLRKHHCRACGGVFCFYCCSKYIDIPENLIEVPQEEDTYKQKIKKIGIATGLYRDDNDGKSRVCNICYDKINNLMGITELISECEKGIIDAKINLNSLYKIMNVSQDWCFDWYNVSIHQLSKFRSIQYKSINNKYDDWERQILWSSRESLVGHNGWIPCMIRSVLQMHYELEINKFKELCEILTRTDQCYDCWTLMCSRKCKTNFDLIDFIEIIKFIVEMEKNVAKIFWFDNELKEFTLFLLENLFFKNYDEKYVISIIPLLCLAFSNLMECDNKIIDDEYIRKVFSKFAVNNKIINREICLNFLNEIHYLDLTKKSIGTTNFVEYVRAYFTEIVGEKPSEWLSKMRKCIINIMNKKKIDKFEPIIYPFDTSYVIGAITHIKEISSYTRPLLVTALIMKNEKGTTETAKEIRFIIKQDTGLRKEKIVTCLISVLQQKLQDQSVIGRLDMFEKVPSYRIEMMSNDIGVVEFVENSMTLRMINDTGQTLQNYIFEKKKTAIIGEVTMRFAKSLAVSNCISYVIGLGDRHLDNIMIKYDDVLVFPIDFNHIMSNPLSLFKQPEIKITNDMLLFLGGYSGIYYNEFIAYFLKVYDVMRLYKNVVIDYFEMLAHEDFISYDIYNKLDTRFMEGMTAKDIKLTLTNEIKTSSATLSGSISDLCHGYRQKLTGLFS